MDTTTIDPKLLNSPLFQELMAEWLAMQDRFAAEPVYAKTGKGYLKSAGVEELQRVKVAPSRACASRRLISRSEMATLLAQPSMSL